ncbi:hypothetical protein PLICRDRAFT_55298 [Plicaturopsis crispa FD-325 SS-3]|nr:hypothetical protein PLICRDRAFT_55298 [Plicaturopsis crispa FD-325 SS-3]
MEATASDIARHPEALPVRIGTAAEQLREKRLRDDPMADVEGPLYIRCKRCNNRIKLSPKSTYDPFHWKKHRERCLKKDPAAPKMTLKERRAIKSAAKSRRAKFKSASSPPNTATDSLTPPLTPDDGRSRDSSPHRVKEESPSPTVSGKRSLYSQKSNLAFEEYLRRSQRQISRHASPPNARAWNWDQLRPPVWILASNGPAHAATGVDDDTADDEMTDVDDDPAQFPLSDDPAFSSNTPAKQP